MGAIVSKKSALSVKCPECKGANCPRCHGTGTLEKKGTLPLEKQNTGVKSRLAWIKNIREALNHTLKHQTDYFKKKEAGQSLKLLKSKKAHAEGEQIKKHRENLEKDPHHQSDMYMHKLKEDAPTNSMGLSSSDPATGAIDTYDPVLDLGGGKVKNKMRKKLFKILRRKLAEK